jgi:thioredoxin family protein
MKRVRWAITIAASLMLQLPAMGQSASTKHPTSATKSSTASSSTPSQFAPLESWKAAVIGGDLNALKALYTTDPPAQSRSPIGESTDPAEEPLYWASLAPQGLHDFNPKILEVTHPQTGVTILVLRIEFSLGKGVGSPMVVGGSQAWINQNGWKIVQSQRSDPHPAPQRRLPEPAKFNTDLYAPPQAAAGEIAEALAKAKADHKRVILMFGGNWCIDCHVLDAALHSKTAAPLLTANYILVHVNIGDAGDENQDLAAKYDTPLAKGVPALAVLNPDGSVVYSQKQGEFESSVRIGPEDVVNFLEKWKPAKG